MALKAPAQLAAIPSLSTPFYIGTAGWNIPKQYRDRFPADGSHLERYAQRFNTVEINSSFYRDHKGATYARWRASVPDSFRFAVKLSRDLTHVQRLENPGQRLSEVVEQIENLQEKLGVLLIQLPPSLAFNKALASGFFKELRRQFKQNVALEPRHLSWSSFEARELLAKFHVGRVSADPELAPLPDVQSYVQGSEQVNSWSGPAYFRWHGSPDIYKSQYSPEALLRLQTLMEHAHLIRHQQTGDNNDPVWCIFDNTTFGFATENALDLTERLKPQPAKNANHNKPSKIISTETPLS